MDLSELESLRDGQQTESAQARPEGEGIRETVDFDGFLTGERPVSVPFGGKAAPPAPDVANVHHQANVGLPFRGDGDALPPAAMGAADFAPPGVQPMPGAPAPVNPIVAAPPPADAAAVGFVRPPDPLRHHPPAAADARPHQQEEAPANAREQRRTTDEVIQLIWFDEDEVPRLRRKREWEVILDEMEGIPADEEGDDPNLSDELGDVENRRDVFEILAHARPTEHAWLRDLLKNAVREGGRFATPLVLVAGELWFEFDELEQLKAVKSAAMPFSAGDEALTATIGEAHQFLDTPNLSAGPDVPKAMVNRIRSAFAAAQRPVADDYLDSQSERALLSGRHYQKRDVLGARHLRAMFQPEGVDEAKKAIPTYMNEDMCATLPMYDRFAARLIAELSMREDQYESHPACLRIVAIARVLPRVAW